MKKLTALLLCGCILFVSGCSKDEYLAVEQQVIELVNRQRSSAGLKALRVERSLMGSCHVRAEELVTNFSHTRPDGSPWSSVITATNKGAAENIAAGYASAEAVMNGWMNSQGHRGNILNENFTHIGVGYYKNGGTSYWVQLFIRQ